MLSGLQDAIKLVNKKEKIFGLPLQSMGTAAGMSGRSE